MNEAIPVVGCSLENIKWLFKKGKCCDAEQEYYTVDSVKFNGVLIKPENGVYQLVK